MDILGIVNFSEFEKNVYDYVCVLARDITSEMLKIQDEQIKRQRDKKRYKIKDTKKATIKTVYGEVEYSRRYYYDTDKKEYVYLLDEMMDMDKFGTISANLAEKISEACINMPYRKAAKTITETTGQSISSHGAWNVIQAIGGTIKLDEKIKHKQMDNGRTQGKRKADVLFMEADGVYLNMQHKKKKAKSRELKLFTIYEGWDEEGKRLVNKKVYIGMESADKFSENSEALVQSIYDTGDSRRILNGDGAAWISNTYDMNRTFQLDRFHIKKKMIECVKDKNVLKLALNKFTNSEYDELIDIIETYNNSIITSENKAAIKAGKDIYSYLINNRDGLKSWQEQVGDIPEAPEGMRYKNMGVQEGQNCSLITMRMKHRRMRWSDNGADNLGKLIYTKENGDLRRIIAMHDGIIPMMQPEHIIDMIKPGEIAQRIGKGNKYIEAVQAHVPVINTALSNTSTALKNLFSNIKI